MKITRIGLAEISLTVFVVCGLLTLILILFPITSDAPNDLPEISLSTVAQNVNNGQVDKIEVVDNELYVTHRGQNAPTYRSTKTADTSLPEQGIDLTKISVIVKNKDGAKQSLVETLLPITLISSALLFWISMLYDNLQRNRQNRLIWAVILLFTFIVGALIYYLVVYRRHYKNRDTNYESI